MKIYQFNLPRTANVKVYLRKLGEADYIELQPRNSFTFWKLENYTKLKVKARTFDKCIDMTNKLGRHVNKSLRFQKG